MPQIIRRSAAKGQANTSQSNQILIIDKSNFLSGKILARRLVKNFSSGNEQDTAKDKRKDRGIDIVNNIIYIFFVFLVVIAAYLDPFSSPREVGAITTRNAIIGSRRLNLVSDTISGTK
jgi:hypothetical protein